MGSVVCRLCNVSASMLDRLQLTGTPRANKLSGVSGDLPLIRTSLELHNRMRLDLVLALREGESTSPLRPALNCLQHLRGMTLISRTIHLPPPKLRCEGGIK